MIQNIIWDVGGTLFDTYPAMTSAFLHALAESSITAPADWVRSLAQVSQKYCAHTLSQTYHLNEEDLWQQYRRYFKTASPAEQPPFLGVREVCVRICEKGGLNLIATHRARESVEQLLQAHHLSQLFAACLTTSDGFPRKPDPTMLNALVEQHALNRAQTLTIGDREIDILAGKAAHLPTCLFGQNAGEATPDFRVNDYFRLLEIL